ncbi:dihydrodipicolinate synthase [Nonlabens sp. MIC269]|uniref:4-hydroxy-tetrahydrodipicolinate synthase n=1 Tax=Nonlabens sp. MIC269 TaxID=1476901 RepID=UPI00072189BC|nr:4-hydroxy-tetrahydrodipicolinate synthase [Nonlabens sp. MIC269]ALM21865.1 dihydrodipicolinate synthase [Nonlabens sp. MIC269]MEE2801342.1 4-hydroxy-tetrahydrodipicolinate synthase [Bacteroidota bacterium]
MQQLKGTGVALVTPFKANGDVDHSALQSVVNYQIDNGIEYLVVLGTTGESVTLSKQEKQDVVKTVVETNAGRLPLVIGIGGSNTAVVVDELKQTDLSSFDAVLSVSPAYNKPTQEGIYQHFAAVAKATDKPIILYNVPGRTASNMAVDTVVRLANDYTNIVAIKEAAGDLVAAMKMIKHTPDDFLVISGDDMIANAMTLAGGAGVISVIGQGLPSDFSEMIRLALKGNAIDSYKLHHKLEASIDLIFAEGNPGGIKAMLAHLDLCEEHLRLPLVPVSQKLRTSIIDFMNAY